jgi:hypothetical protein
LLYNVKCELGVKFRKSVKKILDEKWEGLARANDAELEGFVGDVNVEENSEENSEEDSVYDFLDEME